MDKNSDNSEYSACVCVRVCGGQRERESRVCGIRWMPLSAVCQGVLPPVLLNLCGILFANSLVYHYVLACFTCHWVWLFSPLQSHEYVL
jgi:hypothetical protein